MAGAFDLRKVLKNISSPLRTQFLGKYRELRKIPLDSLKQTDVDPIVAGLQTMKSNKRREIQVRLQRMVKLESNPGQKVLLEELQQRHPDKVAVWAGQKSRIDKVLWTYLNAPDAFEEAVVFARADVLSGKRCWNRWSGATGDGFAATDDRIATLADLTDVLKKCVSVIGSALGPYVEELTNWIITAAVKVRQWIADHRGLVLILFKVTGAIVLAGAALSLFGAIIGMVASGVTGIVSVIGMIGTAISVAGTVIAGIWGGITAVSRPWQENCQRCSTSARTPLA